MPPKKKKSKAGRKPVDDKATLLGIYVKESQVEAMGGKDESRLLLLDFWKSLVKKKKK
jgi:hypothetical protein